MCSWGKGRCLRLGFWCNVFFCVPVLVGLHCKEGFCRPAAWSLCTAAGWSREGRRGRRTGRVPHASQRLAVRRWSEAHVHGDAGMYWWRRVRVCQNRIRVQLLCPWVLPDSLLWSSRFAHLLCVSIAGLRTASPRLSTAVTWRSLRPRRFALLSNVGLFFVRCEVSSSCAAVAAYPCWLVECCMAHSAVRMLIIPCLC